MPAAVCPSLGIAYFMVPKAASTSVKLALHEINEGTPWAGEAEMIHPRYFPGNPFREEDFAATEETWRFTVVRDPVKRLLSAYGNRVHHYRDIIRDAAPRKRDRLSFPLRHPGLRLLPGPEHFFAHLPRYQRASYTIWHHTTPSSSFLGDDLGRFDAIYRVEDLPELEAELSRRAGRPVTVPREQTGGPKIRFDQLPKRTRAHVLDAARADYALLADYYAPPPL